MGAALTQLASDHGREDLNSDQRADRVAAQLGIAGVSDGVGIGFTAATASRGLASPVIGFGTALSSSWALNAGADLLTDSFGWAESAFGDWL